MYIIKLVFRPLKDSAKAEGLTWRDFVRGIEHSFVPKLNSAVKAALRKMQDGSDAISSRKVRATAVFTSAPKSGGDDEAGGGEREEAAAGAAGADGAGSDDDGADADAKNEEFDEASKDDIQALNKLHAEAVRCVAPFLFMCAVSQV